MAARTTVAHIHTMLAVATARIDTLEQTLDLIATDNAKLRDELDMVQDTMRKTALAPQALQNKGSDDHMARREALAHAKAQAIATGKTVRV